MSIAFRYPGLLWALPILITPWLMEYRRRTADREKLFSQVELLREAVLRRSWLRRMEHWIRPLLRTSFLAALILSFAQPRLTRGARPSDSAPGLSPEDYTTVLILDASYSMSLLRAGQSAFDRSRAEAHAILRESTKTPGILILSDRIEGEQPPGREASSAHKLLDAAAATARPTNMLAGLQRADEWLRGHGAHNQLVILSDLAAHGWHGFKGFSPGVESILLADRAGRGDNVWISSVDRKTPAVLAVELGFSGSAEVPAMIRWNENNRIVSQGAPLPSIKATILHRLPSSDTVRLAAETVSIPLDALPVDDIRYLCAPERSDFSLLVVDGSPGLAPVEDETYYMHPILRAFEEKGLRWRRVTLREAASALAHPIEWDAVMLLNTGPIPDALRQALARWEETGGHLLVSAGDQGPPVGAVDTAGQWGALRMDDTSVHPVPDGPFGTDDFDWRQLRVTQHRLFTPAAASRVFLRTTAGDPLLVESSDRRCWIWTSTLDRDGTNLPSKPLFPVMLHRWLQDVRHREASTTRSLRVGDPLRCPLPTGRSTAWLTRPDGRRLLLRAAQGQVSYDDTDLPGHYRVQTDGWPDELFAVNLDPTESDLAPLDRRRFPSDRVTWVDADQSVFDAWRRTSTAWDAAPLLAHLVLLLFIMELGYWIWGRP